MNLIASPLDENIVYTNIVYGCGVSNLVSQSVFFNLGTHADTDGDGLTDAFERFVSLTNPDADDSDGDLLLDGAENAIGTNPLDWDTDSDDRSAVAVIPCIYPESGKNVFFRHLVFQSMRNLGIRNSVFVCSCRYESIGFFWFCQRQ